MTDDPSIHPDDDPFSTLYVAFVNDRHYDPYIRVFSDRETAIGWARRTFASLVAHPQHIEEQEIEGYEWAASYLEEEDHAHVEAVELDDDSEVE